MSELNERALVKTGLEASRVRVASAAAAVIVAGNGRLSGHACPFPDDDLGTGWDAHREVEGHRTCQSVTGSFPGRH
jgi:hypothetical protein